jgi:hypothetical protein
MEDDGAGLIGALFAVAAAAALLVLVLWLFGSSPGNNITCKKQQNGQYELCLSGNPHPVIVPYSTWRSARVGGYYDTGSRRAFTSVDEDPAVPHGFGGEHGGFGGEGAHGGGGR